MINDDKKLDNILQARSIPAPSSNLAYRITQAAQIPVSQPTSWQTELWRLFVIPKLAYATAFCLMIGLVIGFYSGLNEVQAQDWVTFLDTQEEEWL